MESYLPRPRQKSFQEAGRTTSTGPWKITPRIDPVSEKKYLSFVLDEKDSARVHPDVLSFRARAADAIAPGGCASIIDIFRDNGSIEILTPFLDRVTLADLKPGDAKELLQSVLEALTRFEAFDFKLTDLSLASLGRDVDGRYRIFPTAFVLPPEHEVIATEEPARKKREDRGGPAATLSAQCRCFLDLLDDLGPLLCGKDGTGSFPEKSRAVAAAVDRGDIRRACEAYRELFDCEIEPYLEKLVDLEHPRAVDLQAACEAVLDAASKGSCIVLVSGGPLAGKTTLLRMLAAELSASTEWKCSLPTEWDLFRKGRRRSSPSAGKQAFLVDDIEDKAFVYSYLADPALFADLPPDTLLVLSVDKSCMDRTTGEFIEKIANALGDRFFEVALEQAEPLPGHGRDKRAGAGGGKKKIPGDPVTRLLSSTAQCLIPSEEARSRSGPGKLLEGILAGINDEERQLLEFISVTRLTLPLQLLHSLFSHDGEKLPFAAYHLHALGLIEIEYAFFHPKNSLYALVRPRYNSIARLIDAATPSARRKNLCRTLAVLSEELGPVPPFHYLRNLIEGDERIQAARFCLDYLKKHKGARRPSFFARLVDELFAKGYFTSLPFPGRVFILRELAEDALLTGDKARAEELLRRAVDIIEEAGFDRQVKHADLIVSVSRALADIWESKGGYKRALDLLTRMRRRFQTCLPLPDQAGLMNDIGWLQYRLGDYDKSIESCRLSLTSLNAGQYPLVVAQALNIMGVVHFNTSRYDEAISYYEQSAYLREQGKDYNALSASFNNMALAYQTKGEYEKAFDYYNRSLEIKRKQNNLAGIAAGDLNLALLYLEMHNFSEAEKKCRESLRLSKQVGNTQLTAENLSTLGDIALMRGRFEEAEKQYRDSLELCRKLETINEEMGALRRLSNLYLMRKKYATARKCITRAAELAKRIGSEFETAQIDLILGELEYTQKRTDQALEHYEKAASAFTTLAKYRKAAAVLAKIGMIHAENHRILEAKQHLDRAMDLAGSEIGYELPEEIIHLQNALSSHRRTTPLKGKASQKFLMAFYELSSLSDYTLDRHEFFKKTLEIVQRIAAPSTCRLAMRGKDEQFILYDETGERAGESTAEMSRIFSNTLLLGRPLGSGSPEVAAMEAELKLPSGAGFISIPLKAMGEDLGCLYLVFPRKQLPLSKDDRTFLASMGRQIAGNLRLMLHFEEHLYKEEQLEQQFKDLKARVEDEYRFENLIGKSEEMKKIFRTLNKIKDMTPGILIIGESGTGKTELARAIHYNSPRRNKPFQEIHCAQIPTTLLESELFGHERGAFTGAVQRKLGLCELADGGTIFLDDINVIPMETQTKLLNFLESKSFMRVGGTKRITSNVRIIAASNEDLEMLCREQRFREDLYYRLKVILINIPPLRERKEDIIAIALAFIKRKCKERGIPLKTVAPETMKLLQKAPWRGNVRELQNVLERVVLLCDDNVIYPDSLPEDFLREISGAGVEKKKDFETLLDEIVSLENYSEADPLMPKMETLLAKKMVEHTKAKSKAAALLGITKPTLYSRLEKHKNLE